MYKRISQYDVKHHKRSELSLKSAFSPFPKRTVSRFRSGFRNCFLQPCILDKFGSLVLCNSLELGTQSEDWKVMKSSAFIQHIMSKHANFQGMHVCSKIDDGPVEQLESSWSSDRAQQLRDFLLTKAVAEHPGPAV